MRCLGSIAGGAVTAALGFQPQGVGTLSDFLRGLLRLAAVATSVGQVCVDLGPLREGARLFIFLFGDRLIRAVQLIVRTLEVSRGVALGVTTFVRLLDD